MFNDKRDNVDKYALVYISVISICSFDQPND